MAAWSRRHNGSPDKSNPKPNRQRLAPTRLPAERRDTPKPPEQLGALQGSLEAKKPPFRLKQFFELQRHLRLMNLRIVWPALVVKSWQASPIPVPCQENG